ncbi:hypothetical protein Hanom_Chr00s008669g01741471 [Helianthus anomalus]
MAAQHTPLVSWNLRVWLTNLGQTLYQPSKAKAFHIIETCCLGGWSGHGSRYMEFQHKTNGSYMWFINT